MEHRSYNSNPFTLVGPSWDVFKRIWKPLLLAVVATFGIGIGIAIVLGITAALMPLAAAVLMPVLAVVFGIWVSITMFRLVIEGTRGRSLTLSQAMPKNASEVWRFGITMLIMVLCVLAGFVLLVVPGLIVTVRLSYVPYLVIDEGLSGTAALERSWALTAGRFWEVAGTSSIISLASVSYFVPVVGSLLWVAAGLALIAVPVIRYDEFKAGATRQPDGAGIHPANFLVVVLALIITGSVSANQSARLQQQLQQQQSLEKSVQPY